MLHASVCAMSVNCQKMSYMPERPDVIVASFRYRVHMIAKLQLIVEDDAERLDFLGQGQYGIGNVDSPDVIHLPQLCGYT